MGVGSLQFVTPVYVTEVAPIRVRGLLLMLYNFWYVFNPPTTTMKHHRANTRFSVGGFFAPVALQVMSTYDPNNFRTPVYTQWGHIGLMLIIYIILPESPAWCASKDKADRAKKNMRFIYRGVEGFNIDEQYEVLVRTIEHERAVAAEMRDTKWWSIFKGTNGFRTLVSTWALTSQQVSCRFDYNAHCADIRFSV